MSTMYLKYISIAVRQLLFIVHALFILSSGWRIKRLNGSSIINLDSINYIHSAIVDGCFTFSVGKVTCIERVESGSLMQAKTNWKGILDRNDNDNHFWTLYASLYQ